MYNIILIQIWQKLWPIMKNMIIHLFIIFSELNILLN